MLDMLPATLLFVLVLGGIYAGVFTPEFAYSREDRQGLKICAPEEIAWRKGFIDDAQLQRIAEPLRKSGYGEYLMKLLERR